MRCKPRRHTSRALRRQRLVALAAGSTRIFHSARREYSGSRPAPRRTPASVSTDGLDLAVKWRRGNKGTERTYGPERQRGRAGLPANTSFRERAHRTDLTRLSGRWGILRVGDDLPETGERW